MKRLLFLPALVGVGLMLTGCFEREPKVYEGPRQAAFAPMTSGAQFARTLTNAARADSLVVHLIEAEHHTAPITVNFTVRDTTIGTGASASTPARSGTDYTLVDNGSITFQPGDWAVPIRFNTLRNAAATTTRTMIVELTGGDAEPAANLKRFTVTFAR